VRFVVVGRFVVGGGGGALQYFKLICAISLSVKTLPPSLRDGLAIHTIVFPFPLLKAPLVLKKETIMVIFCVLLQRC